jgi:hypothetical protein
MPNRQRAKSSAVVADATLELFNQANGPERSDLPAIRRRSPTRAPVPCPDMMRAALVSTEQFEVAVERDQPQA